MHHHQNHPDLARQRLGISKVPYDRERVLFETAVAKVDVSPADIGSRLGLSVDTGYDDLDDFDILILRIAESEIGFMRHKGSPEAYSGVCDFSDLGAEKLKQIVEAILPKADAGFVEFDQPW